MERSFRWGIPLKNWWTIVCLVSLIRHTYGTVNISEEDLLLFKDDEFLKCFTSTQFDFTCFFETSDNRTYDLSYNVNGTEMCELFVRKTDEGTLLHICSFPEVDVHLFVEIHLEVGERGTNTSLYNRTVCVEDHFYLDPPFNVSLDHNGEPGQLQVSWKSTAPKYFEDDMMFMIRYSSKSLGQKIKEAKQGDILDSLVPGEVTDVQVTAKCASNPAAGHWSRWSEPARAVVPQSSGDISLRCFTPDLHNITCMWNRSRNRLENNYTLFSKQSLSKGSSWSDWTECLADGNTTDLCRFQVHGSGKFKVKLSRDKSPLSTTFYTPVLAAYKSIRTSPPSHLSGGWRRNKLCLKWETPLPILFAHLQYEVFYQIRGTDAWTILSIQSAETSTCVQLPLGIHYRAKIRAKPDGITYSGDWSDWSDVITGDTPADKSTFLLLCIPICMLVIAVITISLFPKTFSKLKLYFWPPVPNPDKVLQGYLTEINGQRWNPWLTTKPCLEDIAASFLEVMSEDEAVVSEKRSKTSTQLLSAEQRLPRPEPPDQPPGGEAYSGYVTLRKGTFIHNISTQEREEQPLTDRCVHTCTDDPDCDLHCSGNEFLNQSYHPQAEPADGFKCPVTVFRESGNLYTNLPCS
uniref:Class I helical cytokine receptor number 22 n=1 Tax=Tetraodon nigroviridis TaxID=99883 RepID=Q6UAN4_TETNG|nr:class I helical cytokine receptor number 22 [Tetraodon nigroviridis]